MKSTKTLQHIEKKDDHSFIKKSLYIIFAIFSFYLPFFFSKSYAVQSYDGYHNSDIVQSALQLTSRAFSTSVVALHLIDENYSKSLLTVT